MALVTINEDFDFNLSDIQGVSLEEITEWLAYSYTLLDIFAQWPNSDDDDDLIANIKENY